MKKKLIRWSVTAVILAAFVMVFTACGNSTAADSAPVDVTGIYHAQYDMKELFNKEIASEGIALESSINADFTLELKEDESFSFDVDAEAFGDAMVAALRTDGYDMVEKMLKAEGVEEDQFDVLASLSGYDSFDEFVDDMLDNMVDSMKDAMTDELGDNIHSDGTYSVDGTSLTLTASSGSKNLQDAGTINDDGSILLSSKFDDGASIDLLFVKE